VGAHRQDFVKALLATADLMQGGLGRTSKFPPSPQLMLVLDLYALKPDSALKEFLTVTLDAMARRGLRDHVGGGFFRYTVDPSWKTPHFEKMLYDNAQLARIYLRAGRLLDRPDYRRVAEDTARFLMREMRANEGAYIAALSAVDNRDVEGGYYLWREAELKRLLTEDERRVVQHAWRMQGPPPFDAGYLPWQGSDIANTAAALRLDGPRVEALLASAADKLHQARQQRRLPRDTKLLAGWNGLMLTTLSEMAGDGAGDPELRRAAQGVRDYLMKQLWDGKRLRRAIAGSRELGAASLEDYAYVAEGLLAWARLTGDEADYAQAQAVAQAAWKRFYGPRGWQLTDQSLMAAEPGQDVLADGPIPAPSAVLIRVTLALAAHRRDGALRRQALAALNSGHGIIGQDVISHASHIAAMVEASNR
jgi:uncharacterized protein YyaL (SSP411 family)